MKKQDVPQDVPQQDVAYILHCNSLFFNAIDAINKWADAVGVKNTDALMLIKAGIEIREEMISNK